MAREINFNVNKPANPADEIFQGVQQGQQAFTNMQSIRENELQMQNRKMLMDQIAAEEQRRNVETDRKKFETALSMYKDLPNTSKKIFYKSTIAPIGSKLLGAELPPELPENSMPILDDLSQLYKMNRIKKAKKDPNDPALSDEDMRKATLEHYMAAVAAGENDQADAILNVSKQDRPAIQYQEATQTPEGGLVLGKMFAPNVRPVIAKPDTKKQEMEAKAQVANANNMDNARLTLGKIDEALGMMSGWTTGMGAKALSGIPGTEAKNLRGVLDTIKANLGFEKLAEMKAQNRAGASGLGALSDREMQLLTSAITNLDQEQSQDQLVKNLNEVKTRYSNWMAMQEGVDPYKSNSPSPQSSPGGAETKTIKGVTYIKQNGKWFQQ